MGKPNELTGGVKTYSNSWIMWLTAFQPEALIPLIADGILALVMGSDPRV
jgi:hypothetical protein